MDEQHDNASLTRKLRRAERERDRATALLRGAFNQSGHGTNCAREVMLRVFDRQLRITGDQPSDQERNAFMEKLPACDCWRAEATAFLSRVSDKPKATTRKRIARATA